MSWRRRLPADRRAALLLALLVVALFREALFSGGVFYWRDIQVVWHPQVESFVRGVIGAAWPLWDPSLGFGQPLLADPSAQVLYPPTWLNLVLRPWTFYTLFVCAHTLLGALGLYALARRCALGPPGALAAAALWTLSGPYLSLVSLWHHFAGASWLPVVILAWDVALSTRRLEQALLAGFVLGLQILAGSADLCAITLLAIAGLALARHVRFARGSLAHNLGLLRPAAISLSLAVGLGGGLWLPALDVVSRAARLHLPGDVRTYWSVHPVGMIETLLPGLWSSLVARQDLRHALYDSREPFLTSLYLGLPAAGLVAAAAACAHPLRRALLALVLLAGLVALGRHAPAYAVLVTLLPPLRILRYPMKAMILVAFGWSLLAGLGYEAWRRPDSLGRRRWRMLVAAPAAALGLAEALAALVLWRRPQASAVWLGVPGDLDPALALRPTLFRLEVGVALATALAVLAFLRASRPSSAARWAGALALLSVLDLFVFHRTPSPTAPAEFYKHRPEVVDAIGDPAAARVYVYDYSQPGLSWPGGREKSPYELARQPVGWSVEQSAALGAQMALAPQTSGRFGLLGGFDHDYRGLFPREMDQLQRLLLVVEGTPAHLKLLQTGGITHVVSLHDRGFESLPELRRIRGLFTEPIRLRRVPDPLPRTYAVSGVRVAEGLEALRLLIDDSFDPHRELVLPPAEAAGTAPAPPGAAGSSRIVESRADRVVLEADLQRAGYVVLLDSYDPGWQATLDGAPAPVLRANTAFRAVRAPAGRHRLAFVYRPRAVLVGLSLSGLSLLAGLALLARAARRAGARTAA